MRRLIAPIAVVVVSGVSCVSDPPVEWSPLEARPYRWRPVPVNDVPPPAPYLANPVAVNPARRPPSRRPSSRWTSIVIHHSATTQGSAPSFDRNHRDKGWDELGYHFVIGNGSGSGDGQIEVGPRWYKQKHGAHCKTLDNHFNEHGIGICLVGDFTKTTPTRKQLASLTHLVASLCSQCGISPDRIVTHGAVTGKTACPGRNFSIRALRRNVAARMATVSARR